MTTSCTVFVFRTIKDITGDPRDVDLKQPLSWPLQVRLFRGTDDGMDGVFARFREALAFHDAAAVSGMVKVEQLDPSETPELQVNMQSGEGKEGDDKGAVDRFMWETMTGGQEPFPEGSKASSDQGVYVCARSNGTHLDRVQLTIRRGWNRTWPALDVAAAVENKSADGVQVTCRWFANLSENKASPVVYSAARFFTTPQQMESVLASSRKRKEAPAEAKEPPKKRAKTEQAKPKKKC